MCNGGIDASTVLDKHLDPNHHCKEILNGDMWVADTLNPSKGLCHTMSCGMPTFICLPRRDLLEIFDSGQNLCSVIHLRAKSQSGSLSTGKCNHVFIDKKNKYSCVSAYPGRAERGVQSGLYRLHHGFKSVMWDAIQKLLKQAEYAFDRYMGTEIEWHIVEARKRVKYATMKPSPEACGAKSSQYFNGVAFGINVYLRSHTDKNLTFSIVQAHINIKKYEISDSIVCYFTFPRIGTAVALRPCRKHFA